MTCTISTQGSLQTVCMFKDLYSYMQDLKNTNMGYELSF